MCCCLFVRGAVERFVIGIPEIDLLLVSVKGPTHGIPEIDLIIDMERMKYPPFPSNSGLK